MDGGYFSRDTISEASYPAVPGLLENTRGARTATELAASASTASGMLKETGWQYPEKVSWASPMASTQETGFPWRNTLILPSVAPAQSYTFLPLGTGAGSWNSDPYQTLLSQACSPMEDHVPAGTSVIGQLESSNPGAIHPAVPPCLSASFAKRNSRSARGVRIANSFPAMRVASA